VRQEEEQYQESGQHLW